MAFSADYPAMLKLEAVTKELKTKEEVIVKISTESCPTCKRFKKEIAIAGVPELVIIKIAELFQVTVQDLKGKSRLTEVVRPRQMACFIIHKVLKYTAKQTGGYLNLNHSTVSISSFKIMADLELLNNTGLLVQKKNEICKYINEISEVK